MKNLILALLISLSTGVSCDELIQFDNGATAFRTDTGYTYGYSGGNQKQDSGFNDTKTGDRYERMNRSQIIDTKTGEIIIAHEPDKQRGDDE